MHKQVCEITIILANGWLNCLSEQKKEASYFPAILTEQVSSIVKDLLYDQITVFFFLRKWRGQERSILLTRSGPVANQNPGFASSSTLADQQYI